VEADSLYGAAQESNLPSRGLHDLTGFEGLLMKVRVGANPHDSEQSATTRYSPIR
jgi:hypothetical protein